MARLSNGSPNFSYQPAEVHTCSEPANRIGVGPDPSAELFGIEVLDGGMDLFVNASVGIGQQRIGHVPEYEIP